MILFKQQHVEPILSGKKTQTRRLWKRPRVKVGAIHRCYTKPPWGRGGAEPFAQIRVLALRQEKLGDITDDAAQAEGYPNMEEFVMAFLRINEIEDPNHLELPLWVVEFEVCRSP